MPERRFKDGRRVTGHVLKRLCYSTSMSVGVYLIIHETACSYPMRRASLNYSQQHVLICSDRRFRLTHIN